MGLYRYAVSAHPVELAPELPPKKSWIRLCAPVS